MLTTTVLFIMKIYDIIFNPQFEWRLFTHQYVYHEWNLLIKTTKHPVFTHLVILLFTNQLYAAYHVTV